MWTAYNTKEKKNFVGVDAQILFSQPNQEKWLCCNQPNCPHCEVTPIKGHLRTQNWVTSHFRTIDETKKCNNTKESDRHFNLKMQIYSLLKEKKLRLDLGNLTYLFNSDKVNVEKIKEDNRADVLLEFKNFDEYLGRGIVFEITVSETHESVNKKNFNWTKKKFSIAWINGNQIEDIKNIDTIKITNPYFKQLKLEMENISESISNKLRGGENFVENLDKNFYELETKFEILRKKQEDLFAYDKEKIIEDLTSKTRTSCRTCKHSAQDKRNPNSDLLCCWKERNNGKQKFPDHVEQMYSCKTWVKK